MENEYGIRAAAKLIGIKARTVRDWIYKGKIRAYKNKSNKWLITQSEIEKIREKIKAD